MKEHQSQKRFKTAGARILRTRKLPKDFFHSHDRNLRGSQSTHSQKDTCQSQKQKDGEKKYPDIFEFTFMAKESCSLRKTKSNVFFSSKQQLLPPLLRRTIVQKENAATSLPIIKSNLSRHSRQPQELPTDYKRKLHKISLTLLNRH